MTFLLKNQFLTGNNISSTKENISMTHTENDIKTQLDENSTVMVKNVLLNKCIFIDLFVNNNLVDILCISEHWIIGKRSDFINISNINIGKRMVSKS